MDSWSHRVRVLGKISQQHPQSAYAGLGMLFQLKCQYLKKTATVVSNLMSLIEEDQREKFFPVLFRREEINDDFRKILGHSVRHGSLGILDPGFRRDCL